MLDVGIKNPANALKNRNSLRKKREEGYEVQF